MNELGVRRLARFFSCLPLTVAMASCTGSVDAPSDGSGPSASGAGTAAGAGSVASPAAGGMPGAGASPSAGGAGSSASAGAAAAAGTSSSPGGAPTTGTEGDGALGTVAIQNRRAKAIARLTSSQFVRSAAALMGEAALVGIEALLPEQDIQDGLYRNTGFAQEQLFSVVQAYDSAATAIVAKVTSWPAFHQRWGACTQQTCIKTFLRSFVEAAFRRPITEADIDAFKPILDASAANALSYDDTVQLLVRAILQSPEFVYLFFDEALTDYQLAARLSYVITDGPPDAELYAAAKAQELRTPAGLEKQVDRLLATGMTAFAHAFGFDYLALRKATTRNVNQTDSSTAVDEALIRQFMASATDSFAHLMDQDWPVGSVLTTDTFIVNGPTAKWLSGQASTATTFQPTATYPFMGMLTHPAVLIAISNAVFGSTVSRGQYIASQVLCVPPVPEPPPGVQQVDLSAELPPNPTARDHGEARMRDGRCAGCHAQFESYSFALNKWGGDGLYKEDPRLTDNGPVTTGLGDIAFGSYKDFLPKLAESAQFQHCITDQVIRFGLQHTEYPPELVQAVLGAAASRAPAVTFRSLIKTLVQQPIFTTR